MFIRPRQRMFVPSTQGAVINAPVPLSVLNEGRVQNYFPFPVKAKAVVPVSSLKYT
jgi:hypothetical protein